MIDEKYERRVAYLQAQRKAQFKWVSVYEVARRCGINPQRVREGWLIHDQVEIDLSQLRKDEQWAITLGLNLCLAMPRRLKFANQLKEPTR